ncbi:putative RNA methyltransferase [uncultured Friedmanniella sp.]|uniref:putative RNA methyltransferase n=1 Tax=uncultured Friedmanniella sp. TaxID=335381 RepID=UPI0035CAD9CB
MSVLELLDLLRCPVCTLPLTPAAGAVRCAAGHTFDLARQGYLNLLQGRPPRHADTADMVAARERFLGAGHYAPIAARLAASVRDGLLAVRGTAPLPRLDVLEVGAGTGYYLRQLLDALPGRGLALDISVAAARRAARVHPHVAAVVADTWQPLPVPDGSLDAVTCVFAPRNAAEFARVLRPDGILAVVAPLPEHLAALRRPLGLLAVQEDKQERLSAALEPWFTPLGEEPVRAQVPCSPDAVRDLVTMGPNAFHTDAAALTARIAALPDPVPVEVAVTVRTWHLASG